MADTLASRVVWLDAEVGGADAAEAMGQTKAGQRRFWAWMPYGDGTNRAWILGELGQRIRPDWNKQQRRWEIAREHLWVLTEAMADRFGEVDLYMEFSNTERCDARCENAVSTDVSECVCSCGGDYHGGRGERRDWKLSGATTLISTGDTKERHIVIRRGDRLTRPEVSDLPPPEHITEPPPTWVEPTPQPLRPHHR